MELIAFPRQSAANHEGPLTTPERSWLRTLEATIETNLKGAFYEVGIALKRIRDNRLYRDSLGSFDEYCRVRWDLSRRHADRLILSSEVVDNLKTLDGSAKLATLLKTETHGSRIPFNERQVRPLTKLSAAFQKEAWQAAVNSASGGRVTAKHVNKAVADIMDWQVKPVVEKTKEQIKTDPRVTLEFKAAFEALLNIIQKERENRWREMSWKAALKHVESLITIIRL